MLAAFLGVAAAVSPALNAQAANSPYFSSTGSMSTPRWLAAAAPLHDGRVLVTGGRDSSSYLSSAEIYDPATGSFSSAGSPGTLRWDPVAAPLADGRVLVAGGFNESEESLSSAEIYDPSTGSFSSAGSMGTARWSAVAAPLADGRVLIAGGFNESDEYLASAEIYDPATGSFSSAGSMSTARFDAVAAPLPNGRVLVAGGRDGNSYLSSAEIYDPATNSFSSAGSMGTMREGAFAAPLPDGRVVVAGGFNESDEYLSSAEIFDPATKSFSSSGIGSMGTPRLDAVAAPLPNGQVLVAGGSDGSVLSSAEVFVPVKAKAKPKISGRATANAAFGLSIADEATVSEGSSPGGTITFRSYGPNDPTCAKAPAYSSTAVAVSGNGTYSNSPAFTPSAAGSYHWTAAYSGDSENEAAETACSDANGISTVNAKAKGKPTISGRATASAASGQPIADEATVSGGSSPGGTITFRAYGPNDPTCAGAPAYSSAAVAVTGNGSYGNSPSFTPSAAGSYRWTASYSGDSGNEAAATACGEANGISTVNASTVPPPTTPPPTTPPPTSTPPATPPPAPKPPSNAFSFSLKGTTLKVSVQAPGRVEVGTAPSLMKSAGASGAPPTITVSLRLTKQAKMQLKTTGKLKVTTQITFTPTGGTALPKTAKLTLKNP